MDIMAQSVSRGILLSVFIYIVKDIISGDTSRLFWYIYLFDGSCIAPRPRPCENKS